MHMQPKKSLSSDVCLCVLPALLAPYICAFEMNVTVKGQFFSRYHCPSGLLFNNLLGVLQSMHLFGLKKHFYRWRADLLQF